MKNQLSIFQRAICSALALLMLATIVPPVALAQEAVRTQCGSSSTKNKLTTEDQNRICQNTQEWDNTPICGSTTVVGNVTGDLPAAIPPIYRDLLTKAANQYNTSAHMLGALFLSENGNVWKPFDTQWKDSSAGASGPFQFMPGTWAGYKVDGNNDGKIEVTNMWDSAFAAANMISQNGVRPDTPLGSIETPFVRGYMLYMAAAYNWGGGNVERKTDPGDPLSKAPEETREYLKNIYALISSGFTKGDRKNYPSVPVNNVGDGTVAPGAPSSTPESVTSTNGECACGGTKSLIVIDPGHSGTDRTRIDSATGLSDHDYPNHPELEDVFDVAQLVRAKLEQAGYEVVMTKTSASANASHRERAEVANSANAALAISIHTQAGANGGLQFGKWAEIYAQQEGGYRQKPDGSKVTFDNKGVADKSQQYAEAFKQTRAASEGITPTIKVNSFDGRAGIAPGNLALVQLFSKVPWVYQEAGGNSAGQVGLNQADKQKYADGLIAGVQKAVPVTNGSTTSTEGSCGVGASGGAIVDTAVRLSWPEPWNKRDPAKEPGRTNPLVPTAAYLAALQQFNPTGKGSNNGADCGVFVSTVMRASGADPNYPPIGTGVQKPYLQNHPEKYQIIPRVGSTNELKPGDILIVGGTTGPGHTLIFIGNPDQHGGYNAASASLNDRAPNLGMAITRDERGDYMIARPKMGVQ